MLTTKKISPIEFRLSNKAFYIDHAPTNYFERFRFEIIFNAIVKGFCLKYGIYFYLHKLKINDDKLLFQLYYYKIRHWNRIKKYNKKRLITGGFINFLRNDFNNKFKKFAHYQFYYFNLFRILRRKLSSRKNLYYRTRVRKKSKRHYRRYAKSVFIISRYATPTPRQARRLKRAYIRIPLLKKKVYNLIKLRIPYRRRYKLAWKYEKKWYIRHHWLRIKNKKWKKKIKRYNQRGFIFVPPLFKKEFYAEKEQNPRKRFNIKRWYLGQFFLKNKRRKRLHLIKCNNLISYKFFFNYFFLHFFKHNSLLLIKSLYKNFFLNKALQAEHFFLLYKARYILRYKWSKDFFFFIHYGLVFRNSNFILPILVQHLAPEWYHLSGLKLFFNILRRIFYYKTEIRGIRLLVTGVFDQHGRTRWRLFTLGFMRFIEEDMELYYDAIQLPTIYGIAILKIWIAYFQTAGDDGFWRAEKRHKVKLLIRIRWRDTIFTGYQAI